MTQLPESTPPVPEQPPRHRSRRILKTLAITGVASAAVGTAGYVGLNYWIHNHLPGLLAAELSKVLDRPVKVGKVEGFSLSGIRIGETTLPEQLGAPESLAIGSIDVGYTLPGLLARSLPVSISLNNISVSAKQTANGTWVSLAPKLPEWQDLPVNINAKLRIKDAKAVLVPYGKSEAITIPINGTVQLIQSRQGQARYNADLTLAGGRLRATGETQMKTGQSQVNAKVENLGLAQFNPLNPVSIARLTDGRLDADVKLEIPDFSFKDLPTVQGTAKVAGIEVRADQLSEPLTASANLQFQGKRALVERARGSLGDAIANVSGTVDWSAGIKDAAVDLAIDIPPVNLKALQQTLGMELPIAVDGSFQGALQLTGTLSDPVLTGDFDNSTPTQVDKVEFSRIRAQIAGDRTRLALTDFRAIPTTGGQITAQGEIDLPEVLTSLDPLQLPIALEFRAQLPIDRLAAAYGAPATVRLGTAVAQGRVQGVVSNPAAIVAWQLPSGYVQQVGAVSGSGRAVLASYRLSLEDTALRVGNGTIRATGGADLASLRWQLAIAATNLDVSGFKPVLAAAQSTSPDPRDCFGRGCPPAAPVQPGLSGLAGLFADSRPVPPLNARLTLSGDLNGLLTRNPATTIVLDAVTAAVGGQTVTATGRINLAKPANWTAVTIIDVAVRSNLSQLPVRSFVSPQVAEQVNLAGLVEFKGQIVGQNLLGNLFAPGNLRLVGDVALRDVAANRLQFEPLLMGKVDAGLGRAVSVSINGKHDRILATLDPCLHDRCPFLYLPNALDVRLENSNQPPNQPPNQPLEVTGNRQGDRFLLNLKNFDLALLNLSFVEQFGLPGPIVGNVNADLDLNLYTLATTGSLRVAEPGFGLGYIQTNEFASSFTHRNGLIQLTSTTLRIGSSRYDMVADLNLNSGAVNANINALGNLQDILTMVGWSQISDLSQGLPFPGQARAADLTLEPVGNENSSLVALMDLLTEIDQRLPARSGSPRSLQPPTQLAVNADYTGTITLTGTITNPALSFEFQGKDWQWYPDRPARMFKDKIVTINHGRVITLDRVLARGRFQDGILTIATAEAELYRAVANLQASLSLTDISGTFRLDNFPLEQLQQVVSFPVDLKGRFSAGGTLAGELLDPRIDGTIAIEDTSLNTTALKPILGEFRYADARFDFKTTQPSSMQVAVSVPFTSGERLSLEVNLDTEAIALLGALSRDQLALVDGNGSVQLKAGATVDLTTATKPGLGNLTAIGTVALRGITFKTPLLQDALILDGDILLTSDRIRIESLLGQFSNSKLVINGALGLLEPLPDNDPDALLPLNVTIDRGRLDLATAYGSYNGFIDTQISIARSLMDPMITGGVRLYEGGLFLSPDTLKLADLFKSSDGSNPLAALDGWMPTLDNFEVTLGDGFRIQALSVFVRPGGSITISGTLDRLRPEGIVQVYRGEIDFLSNQFYIAHNRKHTVTFSSAAGLLNPTLDIQFQTMAQERPNTQRRTSGENEIRQDIVPNLRPEDIDIYLTIQGEAQALLDELQRLTTASNSNQPQAMEAERLAALQRANACVFRDRGFIAAPFTEEELTRLSACLRPIADGQDRDRLANAQQAGYRQASYRQSTDRQLVSSSIIKLESNPQRSESEIAALLGNESLALVEDIQRNLQRGDQGAIAQFFGYRYLVAPTLRETVAGINDTTKAAGSNIGLTDLRVLPTLRATRQVGSQSFVDLEYDYSANQSRLLFRASF